LAEIISQSRINLLVFTMTAQSLFCGVRNESVNDVQEYTMLPWVNGTLQCSVLMITYRIKSELKFTERLTHRTLTLHV